MNNIKQINKLSQYELDHNVSDAASWHLEYNKSPYVFVGGLHPGLTEGDLRTVFSQVGRLVHIDLVRDEWTGQSKGYAFLAFEDQRSTNLAVDNFNGQILVGRHLKVDHVRDYSARRQSLVQLEAMDEL